MKVNVDKIEQIVYRMALIKAIGKLTEETFKALDAVCPEETDKKCDGIMNILLAQEKLLEYTSKIPMLER